jgi:hypothetical protein
MRSLQDPRAIGPLWHDADLHVVVTRPINWKQSSLQGAQESKCRAPISSISRCLSANAIRWLIHIDPGAKKRFDWEWNRKGGEISLKESGFEKEIVGVLPRPRSVRHVENDDNAKLIRSCAVFPSDSGFPEAPDTRDLFRQERSNLLRCDAWSLWGRRQ